MYIVYSYLCIHVVCIHPVHTTNPTFTHTHTHTYTHTYIYTHTYTHTHIYIYIHTHTHTHIYIYTHTHTHAHTGFLEHFDNHYVPNGSDGSARYSYTRQVGVICPYVIVIELHKICLFIYIPCPRS
jgi:hypothetical protein